MNRLGLIACTCLGLLIACGDDEDDPDAGGPGVCVLEHCPKVDAGIACCTPTGGCGHDPSGTGLACQPLPGSPLTTNVCVIADCAPPAIGNACCTPYGTCGFDPFGTGQICFANPPSVNVDAGSIDAAVCEIAECPLPDAGFSCCLPSGQCGVDPYGFGVCYAGGDLQAVDGGPPPVYTEPPDDPSVTGECPSFLSVAGPVWGCCTQFGVCGTYAFDNCLIPVGTPLPVDTDEDAGSDITRCAPPPKPAD